MSVNYREKAVDARKLYRTIFALNEVQKLWGQPVAELVQCRLQLLIVDRAGSVSIEMKEHALPVLRPFW